MSRKSALAAFFAGRAARIILAGSDPADAPENPATQVNDIILSNLVVREDASNGLVGYLYALGTPAAVTFSITVDADGIFSIVNGNELHKVDSFGTGADYAITIKATETVGGAEYSEAFTIDVIPAEDEEDDSGIGDGGGSGDVEIPDDEDPDADTDPYIEPPVEVVTEVAAKVSGKTGGTSVFLKDWGVPVAGRVYVMKYSADWTGMSAQGRYAAVGFGFKQGNSFHMVGLRGNGAVSTTMLGSRLYGDWRKSKQFTITNDGAATHGTKNGPNWLRLTIGGDGTTYTLESSADGATWAAEITDAAPTPFTDATDATQFGPAAYFYEEDKGPFVISISEFWQKPVNTVLPAITGTAQQGQTLTASTGTWTGAGVAYTYQWKRGGVNIASATASTYVLVLADVGSTITVAVTATNDGGATAATSTATSTVVPLAPVNTVLPAITGTTTENETLTVSNGTWSNTPTGYTYQWKRGGVNISAATTGTYGLQAADVGTTITCTVTATNAGGSTAATSAGVGPIAASGPVANAFDGLSAAMAGEYSVVRRLRSGYAGSLIRVRRADNTEQDIGVDGTGFLNTAALATFAGGGNWRLATIYDQSGNGRNLVAGTNWPVIGTSGVLETINGYPAFYIANASTANMKSSGGNAASFYSTTAYTALAVVRPIAEGSSTRDSPVWGTVDGIGSRVAFNINNDFVRAYHSDVGPGDKTADATSVNVPYTAVVAARFTGANLYSFYNGTPSSATATTNCNLAASTNLSLGCASSSFMTGRISEFVIKPTSISNADLNLIGAAMALVAGVTWTTVTI
jgi:hypothetical protein